MAAGVTGGVGRQWGASWFVRWGLVALLLAMSQGMDGAKWAPGDASASARTNDSVHWEAGVNELGVVPVMMYHAFTSDRSLDDMWTRHIDDFRSDLQWLYDNDFHLISVRALIENQIDVPLGKHPVVLTFDDSSFGQFFFEKNAAGELVPAPTSAVGILDSFFADHPDFGTSGHFGINPVRCFALDAVKYNTWDDCPAKLTYLQDNGYEVGNHTWSHPNLNLATPKVVKEEVGRATAFIDAHVSGPANMSRMLTLPFGEMPDPGTDGDTYLRDGFKWEGVEIELDGMFMVSGGPMYSPSSTWWDPMAITRFNTDSKTIDRWFGAFERGDLFLYTSDGDPDTVTVPDPLPEYLQNEFDAAAVESSGKQLVRYTTNHGSHSDREKDRDDAHTEKPDVPLEVGMTVEVSDDEVNMRGDATTDGKILLVLDAGARLRVVDGPVVTESWTWWKVKSPKGTTGWVVEDYLVPAEE